MSPELKDAMEHAARFARAVVEEGRQVIPIWWLHFRNGERTVIGTPWGNDHEKQLACRGLREAITALGPSVRFVTLVIEGWAARPIQGDKTAPRDRADRFEIIQVSGIERGDPNEYGATMNIVREGGKSRCTELVWLSMTHTTFLANLFSEEVAQ